MERNAQPHLLHLNAPLAAYRAPNIRHREWQAPIALSISLQIRYAREENRDLRLHRRYNLGDVLQLLPTFKRVVDEP